MMTFEEPSQVLDHGWLTLSGGVQGLYTTYRIRQERARREEFPWLVPKTLKLRPEWRDFIEESTSRFDEDCLAPFSFNPPSAGVQDTGHEPKAQLCSKGDSSGEEQVPRDCNARGLRKGSIGARQQGKLTIEGVGRPTLEGEG
jgi:hypothetical protein